MWDRTVRRASDPTYGTASSASSPSPMRTPLPPPSHGPRAAALRFSEMDRQAGRERRAAHSPPRTPRPRSPAVRSPHATGTPSSHAAGELSPLARFYQEAEAELHQSQRRIAARASTPPGSARARWSGESPPPSQGSASRFEKSEAELRQSRELAARRAAARAPAPRSSRSPPTARRGGPMHRSCATFMTRLATNCATATTTTKRPSKCCGIIPRSSKLLWQPTANKHRTFCGFLNS